MGWISYWNLLPLGKELARLKHNHIEQFAGHPTQVNQWLREGKVHLAPCSSINLISDPRAEIAIPIGVSSDGPVKSVYLGLGRHHEEWFAHVQERQALLRDIVRSARAQFGLDARKISSYIWRMVAELPQIPLEKAPRIKFSSASATSVMLSKILYRLWFGHDAYELNCIRMQNTINTGKAPVELVIGDTALVRKSSFYKTYDLGTAWKELTGLPFVFAVWQSMGGSINGLRKTIIDTAELAESKMKVEPTQYYPSTMPVDEQGKVINLDKYWGCINYRLGPDEFKGLLIFLSMARDLKSNQEKDDSNIIKIMRLQ